MEEKVIKEMYEYALRTGCASDGNGQSYTGNRKKKSKTGEHWAGWAGHAIRMMMWFFFTVSFLCLLRSDEALRLRWEFIEVESWDDNGDESIRLKITLPFRKTHQNGGERIFCVFKFLKNLKLIAIVDVLPFYLYPDRHRPHLCPVTAFCVWYTLTTKRFGGARGYIFRKRVGDNGVSSNPEESIVSYLDWFLAFLLDDNLLQGAGSLMECFRMSLLDVGIDPDPYGTHSNRRGGAQWLSRVKRWMFRDICSWAGWSDNLDNPGTLFKYLLSFVDSPAVAREDYMNPNRGATNRCNECGRSCPCA